LLGERAVDGVISRPFETGVLHVVDDSHQRDRVVPRNAIAENRQEQRTTDRIALAEEALGRVRRHDHHGRMIGVVRVGKETPFQ
jgi:hypothetical protein